MKWAVVIVDYVLNLRMASQRTISKPHSRSTTLQYFVLAGVHLGRRVWEPKATVQECRDPAECKWSCSEWSKEREIESRTENTKAGKWLSRPGGPFL